MRSAWLCCRRSLKLRASSFEWFFARNQCAAYNNFPWLTVLIEYAWCETCCSLFISHLTNFVKLCTGTTRRAAPPARPPAAKNEMAHWIHWMFTIPHNNWIAYGRAIAQTLELFKWAYRQNFLSGQILFTAWHVTCIVRRQSFGYDFA